jgi:hypothetical protein
LDPLIEEPPILAHISAEARTYATGRPSIWSTWGFRVTPHPEHSERDKGERRLVVGQSRNSVNTGVVERTYLGRGQPKRSCLQVDVLDDVANFDVDVALTAPATRVSLSG